MRHLFAALLLLAALPAWSAESAPVEDLPTVIPIGAGSYASRPPRGQSSRPGVPGKPGQGDLSQVFTHMRLNVTPDDHGAIPSTDWWTSLVTKEWGGELWAYPLMLRPDRQGLVVTSPRTWELHNKEARLVPEHRLLVRGAGFRPQSPLVESWSDWLVTWRLAESDSAWMRITMGHGLPTTWIETAGIEPRIDLPGAAVFGDGGKDATLPLTGDRLGLEAGGDRFGLFAPAGTVFSRDGESIAVRFAGKQRWLAVGTLTKRADLALFAKYAPAVPRDTKIAWDYQPEKGRVATTWTLTTEDLSGGSQRDVIQGWIPHHYQTDVGTTIDFATNDLTYPTPRGELRCAVGQRFGIAWPFTGLVPELPVPEVAKGLANPFRPEVMRELVGQYTSVTGYGFETYWGGKKILLYAKYMEMAKQLGMEDAFQVFKRKLTEALTDWATYTPGEREHFFGMYPNWGSLMGFRTRDNANPGIDVLQDHAFCYGYHVYAAAFLARHDPQFAVDYGPLFRLVVKDYANWERDDKRFPFFRSLDPWCGHSWSGGTGSDTGNGMESSSESMQAWGAMFVFAEAIGDTAMRDAAAFGYASESRAVAEYWFDRKKRNIPRPLWPFAHNGNTTTDGIGWWTWFSGDPFWMHAIQWLPMSPLLRYLAEDPEFAKADYEAMWKEKKIGGWDANLGKEAGVGNVTLSYLAQFDPDQAAKVFDTLWDGGLATARAKDESGPAYWRIHAARNLGRMAFDAWTDVPTSVVWRDPLTKKLAVSAWNATDADRPCRVFDQGKLVATIVLPPRKIVAHRLDAAPAAIAIESTVGTIAPGAKLTLAGVVRDQYGARFPATVTWSAAGATVTADGTFSAVAKGSFAVTATAGSLKTTRTIRVDATPLATKIVIAPPAPVLPIGDTVELSATIADQYGDPVAGSVTWSITGGGTIDARGRLTATTPGTWTVTANAGGASTSVTATVRVPPADAARGKPTTASSQSAADRGAGMATDGEEESRWQSKQTDDEWLAVDLGALHLLDHAALRWEGAYGKDYDLQGSDDGKAWKTLAEVRGGSGGTEEIPISGTSRWVRLRGLKRGTNWGYSLYEFAVFATPASALGGGVLASLTIEPALVLMSDLRTQRFTATGLDAKGKPVAVTPSWRVEGKGAIDANGLYTPNGGADFAQSAFTIVAEAGGLRATAIAAVEESRKVASLKVRPDPGAGNALPIAVGASRALTATVADQFGARYELPVTWTADGAVRVDAQGHVTATAVGSGSVTASAGAVKSVIACTVLRPEDVNLAAGKPVSASSGTPDLAVDGDPKTRWESERSDPQWLLIDLEAPYALRTATLRWEAARAKAYRIEVSLDKATWKQAFATTDGKGKVDECQLGNAVGRYIRLTCDKRSGGYGNSLWEFEMQGGRP